jgi:hypothetical protein
LFVGGKQRMGLALIASKKVHQKRWFKKDGLKKR